MAGGKLARLLLGVGGGHADERRNASRGRLAVSNGKIPKTSPSDHNVAASASRPHDASCAGSGQRAEPNTARKRRRSSKRKAPPSNAKRPKREAGPATKALATANGHTATGDPTPEGAEKLEEKRQQLLAGRSAYEALMEGLSRGRRLRGGTGASGAATDHLRAHLMQLRSEQLGETSDEEDEDEEGEGEEEEGEEEEASGLGSEGEVYDGDRVNGGTAGIAINGRERPAGRGQKEFGKKQGAVKGEVVDEEEEDGSEEGDRRRPLPAAAKAVNGGAAKRKGALAAAAAEVAAEEGSDWEEGEEDGGSSDGGSRSDGGKEAEEGSSESEGGGQDGTASDGEGEEEEGVRCAAANGESNGGLKRPGAAVVDTWAAHVGRELSEHEVATLAGGKFTYVDAPSAPVHSTAWGANARWQMRVYGTVVNGKRAGSVKAASPEAALAVGGDSAVRLTALPPAPPTLPEYGVKERLVTRWREVRQEEQAAITDAAAPNPSTSSPDGDFATPQQRSLFALLNAYTDVQLPARPYPIAHSGSDPLLDAVLLHCLNHVAKTADRVKKNTHALQQQAEQQQQQNHQHQQKANGGVHGDEKRSAPDRPGSGAVGTPRDQGFTRPKVLVLLPQRNLAFRAVRRLVALALRETRNDSVQGKEKLIEQFTEPEDGEEEETLDPAARARLAARPTEHRALFSGNLDDHFRLGIKITKGAIRLFADFYQSDILVASPVALATKLAEDKRSDPASAPDFLSSVEVLVVDRADMLAMQNWSHVETVLSALNQLPRAQHGTDIMRVRDWYLAGRAQHYRQTVLLSSYGAAEANAVARTCANHAGALRLAVEAAGVLGVVVPQVRQLYERFPAAVPAAAGDARFEFFMRAVWPRVRESVTRGLLLFVPSYFDFVRLRNALRAEDSVDFATISEYSSNAEVTRARARFFHGQRRMLLYTERAHFYHRYRIRGIKDIIFYGLPEHGHYYSELVNLLEAGGDAGGAAAGASYHATVTALFCGWDVLQLERVVGSGRAKKMLRGESSTYMFC